MHAAARSSVLRPLHRAAAIALAAAVALVAAEANPPQPAAAVGGFVSDIIAGGLDMPTDMAFAPDGRIFVAERGGAVRIIKDGVLLPTPFITLVTNTRGERGLVGMALDPNFSANGYVYLYYTVEINPAEPDGRKAGRLIRVTANGDVAQPGSEVILLGSVLPDAAHGWSCEFYPPGTDCLPADNPFHVAGGMRFGPDGKLFLSVGDSAQFGFGTPLRAQHLDKLAGKMLRINPDGTGPSDNPFYNGDPRANRSKVWHYGLRNPFRWGFWPGTNIPMIGDVGTDQWEELNTAAAGANFGWPCYEGDARVSVYEAEPICVSLYAAGTATGPFYSYPRGAGAAIIGGLFYMGTGSYPVEYVGRFFYADYIHDTIYAIHPTTKDVLTVLTPARGAVDFEYGPDGNLWYVAGPVGQVRRLRFESGNLPPVAAASGTPTAGVAPLAVQFSSAGSYDPEGGPLTYAWQFGDGATSTEANPQHTYTVNGTYNAVLTVTDPGGLFATASVPITVGNEPPEAMVLAPHNGAIYRDGDTITLVGLGIDPEDGPLPPNALSWKVFLVHCSPAGLCHEHDLVQATGPLVTFAAPTHGVEGGDYFFVRAELQAKDAVGLTDTSGVLFGPDVNGDRCMDAFVPHTVNTPPFAAGEAGNTASGTSGNLHWETVDLSNPAYAVTATWGNAQSPGGAGGAQIAFAALAAPITVPEGSLYGLTLDADVYGELTATAAEGTASGTLVLLGAVLDSNGTPWMGMDPLLQARAFKDKSGSVPNVTVARERKPFGMMRLLAAGTYQLLVLVITEGASSAPAGAASVSVGDAWAMTVSRQTVLCSLRAPEATLEPVLGKLRAGAPKTAGADHAPLAAGVSPQVLRAAHEALQAPAQPAAPSGDTALGRLPDRLRKRLGEFGAP